MVGVMVKNLLKGLATAPVILACPASAVVIAPLIWSGPIAMASEAGSVEKHGSVVRPTKDRRLESGSEQLSPAEHFSLLPKPHARAASPCLESF